MAWARPDIDLSGYTKLVPVGGGIEYAEADNKGGPYFIDDRSREQFETLVDEAGPDGFTQ